MGKKIIILGIIALLLVGLFGCSSPPSATEGKVTGQTEKNDSDNRLQQLTLEETFQKIENGEDFIFLVTQSTCTYCNSFKRTLLPFLKDHPMIPFYEIEVDMLGEQKADIERNFQKLRERVPEFEGGTPAMFFYQDGELKEHSSGELSEVALANFMIDCGYLDGEKQVEENDEITFEESAYILPEAITAVARRISGSEPFYLMINEPDRYNRAFVEKLIPVLEEEERTIIALRFPLEQQGSEEEMQQAYETLMSTLKDLSISPALFRIEEGKATKLLEDNVAKEVIQAALAEQ